MYKLYQCSSQDFFSEGADQFLHSGCLPIGPSISLTCRKTVIKIAMNFLFIF